MQWYYASNGQRQGPLSEVEFDQRVKDGTVTADTLVWRAGMSAWLPYAQVASPGGIPSPAPALPGEETEVCAVSGKRYPRREMVQYEGRWISAEHRDLYFQRLREGVAAPGSVVYAGFWIRFAAKLIDGLIIGVVLVTLYMVLAFGVFSLNQLNPEDPGSIAAILAFQGIVILSNVALTLLYTWFFLKKYAATPGKMALGLTVVRPDGTPLSNGRIIGRYFAEMLSHLILNIGYIIAAFDLEKRALHDHLCDTRVIKKK
jgi:uncharacterized RDD family membrane protein YckC